MKHLFYWQYLIKMKTLKKISNYIDNILTNWSLNYIDKVSRTLYPKPHLHEKTNTNNKVVEQDSEDEDEPALFI